MLVGRPVNISVGEPWDFEGPDGAGVLKGRIVELYREGGGIESQRVRVEVTTFESPGGRPVNSLVASARHVEDDAGGIADRIARGEVATANFSYAEQVPEDERDPKAPPFLIGSMSLRDRRREVPMIEGEGLG